MRGHMPCLITSFLPLVVEWASNSSWQSSVTTPDAPPPTHHPHLAPVADAVPIAENAKDFPLNPPMIADIIAYVTSLLSVLMSSIQLPISWNLACLFRYLEIVSYKVPLLITYFMRGVFEGTGLENVAFERFASAKKDGRDVLCLSC